MGRWLREPKFVIAGVVVLAGLAWVAFGFFGVHLLFVDDEVDEAAPVFVQSTGSTATGASVATQAPDATAAPAAPAAPATTVAAPAVRTEFAGTFEGLDHPTSGNALVLGDGSGLRFLRFEEFETDNGPDLNVYLVNSAAGGVEDFVDLGDLKGNVGDQNYEIPADVDLSVYDTVLIWCVRFSSPFGQAGLSPA